MRVVLHLEEGMMSVILRPNAAPIYAFLSYITMHQDQLPPGRKILDCGAGGPLPPLALFQQHGFEPWGIDSSVTQLERARVFCAQHDIDLNLQQGDMRSIPFEDATFDFVYEQYAMVHLTRRDTQTAIGEMHRVLKPGGLCFLGVASRATFPPMGQEKAPGEFWGMEGGTETMHSAYTHAEADQLFGAWTVLQKEQRTIWHAAYAAQLTPEDWMSIYDEAHPTQSPEEWRALYAQRVTLMQYVHVYYLLQKPETVQDI